MQTSRSYPAAAVIIREALLALLLVTLLLGCVSHVYEPGPPGNPFNQLKLDQTYGDMVRVLGTPDHSTIEDRTGKELLILFIPVWDIIESIGDYNPSTIQTYTYNKWGTIKVDNNNHIICIEGK